VSRSAPGTRTDTGGPEAVRRALQPIASCYEVTNSQIALERQSAVWQTAIAQECTATQSPALAVRTEIMPVPGTTSLDDLGLAHVFRRETCGQCIGLGAVLLTKRDVEESASSKLRGAATAWADGTVDPGRQRADPDYRWSSESERRTGRVGGIVQGRMNGVCEGTAVRAAVLIAGIVKVGG
jgi:hypothetical protein